MTPRVYEFVAIAIAIVLLGTLGYLIITGHKLLLASGQPVFGDFIAFWMLACASANDSVSATAMPTFLPSVLASCASIGDCCA